MTWDAEKELWLAFRALRAEANRIAGELDKVLRWFNKAEQQYLDMVKQEETARDLAKRLGLVNPPSQGDPNGQARQAESQSVSSSVVDVMRACQYQSDVEVLPITEQSSPSSPQQPDQA